MHPRSQSAFSCCDFRHLSVLTIVFALVLSAGCEEERNVGDKPNGSGQGQIVDTYQTRIHRGQADPGDQERRY